LIVQSRALIKAQRAQAERASLIEYSLLVTAELEVLHDAIIRLERAGIDYMLTGSIALSYYAQPRMTRDIDLVIELSGREAKFVAALFAPSYYVAEADIGRAITEHGMFNILHLDKVVKIDFIIRKDTPYRLHEFERRQRVAPARLRGVIVSREDLILSKLVWAKDSNLGASASRRAGAACGRRRSDVPRAGRWTFR